VTQRGRRERLRLLLLLMLLPLRHQRRRLRGLALLLAVDAQRQVAERVDGGLQRADLRADVARARRR